MGVTASATALPADTSPESPSGVLMSVHGPDTSVTEATEGDASASSGAASASGEHRLPVLQLRTPHTDFLFPFHLFSFFGLFCFSCSFS